MAKESRRVTLWVPLPLFGALQERAESSKLGLSYELRQALSRGLAGGDAAATQESVQQVQLLALSALVAAEQVLRFLAKSFPEGERRMLELKEPAATAAEARLEELKDRLDQEAEG